MAKEAQMAKRPQTRKIKAELKLAIQNRLKGKGGGHFRVPLQEPEGHSVNVICEIIELTFGQWTPGPYSAIIEARGVPFDLICGKGSVDFLLYLMEIRKPRIYKIEVGGVTNFVGADINMFERECSNLFMDEWNNE